MNLSYGSRGDSVRNLQRQLNSRGYQLDEDGIFGGATLAAVKDFQQKNGLSADGIVGSMTSGKLQGTSAQPAAANTSSPVAAAEAYLKQIQSQKPGEYKSPYAGQLDAMYDQIVKRKPFTYDLNADMLYQQYRDQYQNLGQQAMMDTMGQAAGLTGGYGSSYAQNVGQQAYQSYLQQLNNKVPELYRLALDKYNAEGDDLYRQYGLLNDRENTAYGRYRDQVGDWRDEYNRAYQRYGDERNFDYNDWSNMLNYWQNQADRENSEWWKQTEYDYQAGRDAENDRRWQEQFDYQKARDAIADQQWERQFAAAQAARAAAAAEREQAERKAKEPTWGNGYSENASGYGKSEWDKVYGNVMAIVNAANGTRADGKLPTSAIRSIDEYMSKISRGLSKSQWNTLANELNRFGYNMPTF